MSISLAQVTKEAMDLPVRQRIALAGLLLETEEDSFDPEIESAWEEEIANRIQRIDSGREVGVPFEDVIRTAERQLDP
jgi:ribosomal protein S12 methylthiotransferase accessory factor YcaO